MRHLCVYCGSGPGRNPAYMAAAKALGAAMADEGIGLVYGGGSLGLMGEVARSVIAGGGHVVGIIPEFLVNKERMLTEVNELIVTASMHERKMTMFERADGFAALPGGLGTLEELVEISTWAQLDRAATPTAPTSPSSSLTSTTTGRHFSPSSTTCVPRNSSAKASSSNSTS